MYMNSPDGQGFSRVKIDLDKLYHGISGYDGFKSKFEPFLQADPLAKDIITLENGYLNYRTEHIHANKNNQRKRILFLIGNPAVHSVAKGVPFAYEKGWHGSTKEHRFWETLRDTGYVDLPYKKDPEDKKKILLNADYDSKFIVNIEMFFTLPSTASGIKNSVHPIQKKSGVAQIRSLLGKKGLDRIANEERKRLAEIISNCDAVITCQTDAYHGVKSIDSPEFNRASIKEQFYKTKTMNGVLLYCIWPTHLWRSKVVKQQLKEIKKEITG